jgi:endonuclease III
VGTGPDAILEASPATLGRIVRRGGAIGVAQRATRLHQIADRVATRWSGNLRPVLRLPLEAARRELAQYPSIGAAGAERILLLCGSHSVLGLDSNALRVLLRLGYGREFPQWNKTHRVVQEAAARELPATIAARRSAYLLLRRHGQTLCRRSAPHCGECPLQPDCPTGRSNAA